MEEEKPAFRFAKIDSAPSAEREAVIHKESYFERQSAADNEQDASSSFAVWKPSSLKEIPAFYPLEKSSKLITDASPQEIAHRLSECLRQLSVQALYENDQAFLKTAEHVEIHLSLWKASNGIVLEVQRRKGDSMIYHGYARNILAAASHEGAAATPIPTHTKKAQKLIQIKDDEQDNAIVAIEMAHGLLIKDRLDAQTLGLESLCLLTDPTKTGIFTALLAAHVVLLGSVANLELQESLMITAHEGPFSEIKEIILDLVTQDVEHDSVVLHDLALAVLANALDVLEHPERWESLEEESRPRLRTASSNDVTKDFVSSENILAKLIEELGNARQQPHNATLSAQCLGSLFKASDEARKKAHELGAKTVVQTALDVGEQTHVKLEKACKTVVKLLTDTANREEQQH